MSSALFNAEFFFTILLTEVTSEISSTEVLIAAEKLLATSTLLGTIETIGTCHSLNKYY